MTDVAQGLRLRDDFPGVGDWHYLDSAATAQKPTAVIDAIARAYGPDYATVHRGVYERSANMTLAYEAARRKVAQFIGAASDSEVVYVRGATEGINLVAHSWAGTQLKAGDRILLSMLEHHSNIVPWQIVAERVGAAIDVVPLTQDGRIDLDAMAAMITPAHKMVALAHVSNVLGSVLDCRRAADIAHGVGAKILIDGCQAVPRIAVDVQALDCDFYVFSAHKLYGPTGIGALYGTAEALDRARPYQGGGEMIEIVSRDRVTYNTAPHKFEAGTPPILEAIGLGAALDWMTAFDHADVKAHEDALYARAYEGLRGVNGLTIHGETPHKGAVLAFSLEGAHPHDIAQILDRYGIAVRAGHHCAQPLMEHLGVSATARASFAVYNTLAEVDAFIEALAKAREMLV
mgnify:CR=1 FL=1